MMADLGYGDDAKRAIRLCGRRSHQCRADPVSWLFIISFRDMLFLGLSQDLTALSHLRHLRTQSIQARFQTERPLDAWVLSRVDEAEGSRHSLTHSVNFGMDI